MRASALGAVLVLAWMLGATTDSLAQRGPVVVAILPFEDRGSYGQDNQVLRALQLGIPATIAGELSGHSELRLADQQRLAQALEKHNVSRLAHLDAATAAKIGKAAGARYAITGTFADFYGRFRLEARVVDTETGQILKVVSNNDRELQNRADLYRIVQLVGHKVLAVASGSAGGLPAESDTKVVPTEAITHYSLGLLYERQGDNTKAGEHYDQALSAFPNYPEARAGARRVGSRP